MKHLLKVLFWEATLQCNAHCSFCGSSCVSRAGENELTTEEICAAFSSIAGELDPGKIMINVTGGEPLLREDLFEVMRYAVDLGYSWGLVTNGFLITNEIIAKMKHSSMKTIAISIDGPADIHNQIRGVAGGFEKIVDAINALHRENFVECIMITTVVTGKNIGLLPKIKELMCTLPINVWRVCPVDPIGRAETGADKDLLLTSFQQKQVFDFIAETMRENLPFKTVTSCSHYLGEYEAVIRNTPFRCYAGTSSASILANGDIFVCPNVPRCSELIQGNVRRDNFSQVWENKFEYFRNLHSRHTGKCGDCEYFADCRGDSLHTWDFERNSPKFCIRDNEHIKSGCTTKLGKIDTAQLIADLKEKGRLFDNQARGESLSEDRVFVTPPAVNQLTEYFSWGSKSHSRELIAVLLGRVGHEKENSNFCSYIVEEIKPILEVLSDQKRLFITEHFKEQVREIACEAEKGSSVLKLLGFIHTHPVETGIAMSMGDYEFHRALYLSNDRIGISIIADPQALQIAAYSGLAANNINLHLLSYYEPI